MNPLFIIIAVITTYLAVLYDGDKRKRSARKKNQPEYGANKNYRQFSEMYFLYQDWIQDIDSCLLFGVKASSTLKISATSAASITK